LFQALSDVFDLSTFSHINRWLTEGKKLPGYDEINKSGIETFRELLLSKLVLK